MVDMISPCPQGGRMYEMDLLNQYKRTWSIITERPKNVNEIFNKDYTASLHSHGLFDSANVHVRKKEGVPEGKRPR